MSHFISKGALAKEFNICPDTFRKYCLKLKIDTGRRKFLAPSEVRRIKEGFDNLFCPEKSAA